MHKKIFSLTVFCFLFSFLSNAQMNAMSNSTATGRFGAATTFLQDYQTVGINPANLGIWNRETKLVTFGLAETQISIHTSALTRTDIFKKVLTTYTLSDSERNEAIKEFTYHPTAINIEVMPLGFAVQLPKVGGFGFTWRERVGASYSFNQDLADIIYHGIHSTYFDTIITDNFKTRPL